MVVVELKPVLAYPSAEKFSNHSTTSLFSLSVNSSAHCPFKDFDTYKNLFNEIDINFLLRFITLCRSSCTSSSAFLPKPIPITLLLPKKNLLGFQSCLISCIFWFRIFSYVSTYILLYFSTQLLISSTILCFSANPFLSVFVRETRITTK